MNSIRLTLAVAALSLLAGAARAAEPPTGSMDLGALKPRTIDTTSTATPVTTPIGQSPLSKLKTNSDKGTPGSTGIGGSISSPLGTKSILGNSATGGKPAQTAPDDAASSTDVVVKMPSNMKK